MASDKGHIDFIMDQIESSLGATSKKMFGEYAIYVNGKVVALVCDNRLFVKKTAAGEKYSKGSLGEDSPYPGAKPHYVIEDQLDDREWLSALLRATEKDLPAPKPKKAK